MYIRTPSNVSHTMDPEVSKRILIGAIAERIKELLEECTAVNRWRIDEMNIQKDHVHLLILLKPDISVSKAVQLLKAKGGR